MFINVFRAYKLALKGVAVNLITGGAGDWSFVNV